MGTLRALWKRLRGAFGSVQADNEFDAEINSHLQMHLEDNLRSGMTPEQARREALRRLGGVEQTKQAYRERRGLPSLETLWQDISIGLRMLRKRPVFTYVTIFTLALGIGANTAIFSVVKAVLLAPLPYKNPSCIVRVWTANPARDGQPHPSTPGDFAIWKQKSGAFEDMAPSYDVEPTLTGQGSPRLLIGYAVSANYLRILGVEPQIGRLYTDQEDKPGGPKVALLSDTLWRTAFDADPKIVGKAITLDGSRYTVLGVMPRSFNYPTGTEIWTPIAMAPSAFDNFNRPYVNILGRLRQGVTFSAAQKAMNALEAQVIATHPDTDTGNRVVLVSLREQLSGDIRMPLLILMSAAGLVLLIACVNTAGLAIARDAERQKEIAVRLALGATRRRLLRQLMTESLLLTAMGGAAGILLAMAGSHFLLTLFPNDVANLSIPKVTKIPMDGGVFLFAFVLTLTTAFLSGIGSVLKATRVDVNDAMKESTHGSATSRRSNRSRSAIIVIEMALSLMLLTGAGLVVASFQRVIHVDLGFQPDHLLSLEIFLPPNRYPGTELEKTRVFAGEVARRLNALPGVKSAGTTNFLPLSGFWGRTRFLLRGQAQPKKGQIPEADNRVITPEYLPTMEIPLLRGRTFSDADRAGTAQVAMINRMFAKQYFKDKDPIGEELNLGDANKPDWWRIVGVIGDVKAFGQDQPTHPDIYRPFDQYPSPIVAFLLRTKTDPASMAKAAEQAVWSVDPDLSIFKTISMDSLASQTLAVRRASSELISVFALLALILACIGIYGVMAYAVTQRTQEIGVRIALGAQRTAVMWMMLRFSFRLALAGIGIGLVGMLATDRLLTSLLFEISAMNPLIFLSASAVLMAVAILASYLPARRAASINPVEALRAE